MDSPDTSTHAHEIAPGDSARTSASNWTRFLAVLDDERIDEACKSLRRMLGMQTLAKRSFLDVGSGSGLFSLAAMRLGAARVVSFDHDAHSVACGVELKRRYFPAANNWTIEQGNVLDDRYLERLGFVRRRLFVRASCTTPGKLWDALANVAIPVAPGGRLFIAVHRDQGWMSSDLAEGQAALQQRRHRPRGRAGRVHAVRVAAGVVRRLARGRNPFAPGKPQTAAAIRASTNGSTGWGLPFEVASAPAVLAFYKQRRFRLENLGLSGGHGCNEFVFSRSGTMPPLPLREPPKARRHRNDGDAGEGLLPHPEPRAGGRRAPDPGADRALARPLRARAGAVARRDPLPRSPARRPAALHPRHPAHDPPGVPPPGGDHARRAPGHRPLFPQRGELLGAAGGAACQGSRHPVVLPRAHDRAALPDLRTLAVAAGAAGAGQFARHP